MIEDLCILGALEIDSNAYYCYRYFHSYIEIVRFFFLTVLFLILFDLFLYLRLLYVCFFHLFYWLFTIYRNHINFLRNFLFTIRNIILWFFCLLFWLFFFIDDKFWCSRHILHDQFSQQQFTLGEISLYVSLVNFCEEGWAFEHGFLERIVELMRHSIYYI